MTFEASVPTVRGSKDRTYGYFITTADAERWCAAAVNALYSEQCLPEPAGFGGSTEQRSAPQAAFEHAGCWATLVESWRHERYEDLRRANPERAIKVASVTKSTLVPFLEAFVTSPAQWDRSTAMKFVLRLAGQSGAHLTVDEAVKRTGRTERTLRRWESDDLLPETTKGANGRTLYRIGDLESVMGERLRTGYAHSTAKEYYRVFKMFEQYLVDTEVIDRCYSDSVNVPSVDQAARIRKPRAPKREIIIAEVVGVAARLHVVHQLVLLVLRCTGMRIGEAYGLHVEDIIDFGDGDRPGVLSLHRQGGTTYQIRNDAGEIVRATEKSTLKTNKSTRVIVIPSTLMELIRLIVRVFHTDADGSIDWDARLVPGIQRKDEGGQAAFASALKKALGEAHSEGEIEEMFVPHDLRVALITELSDSDVADLKKRRMVGHIAGSTVHDGYKSDRKDPLWLEDVAADIERSIQDATDTLIIPTEHFPAFGRNNPAHSRRDEIRDLLIDAGSFIEPAKGDSPLLDANDIATELGGVHPNTARRLMSSGEVDVVRVQGAARVSLDDLKIHQANRRPNLKEVAQRHGIDYHRLYATMRHLGLQPTADKITGDYAIDTATEAALVAEVERVDALHVRACTVAEAAPKLGIAASTLRKLIRDGQIEIDRETDATGARFIPYESINSSVSQRSAR